MTALRPVTVALDWTPNTNHTGLYVAKAKGWFAEAGLAVHLKSPMDFGEGSYVGELNTDAEKDFPTPCGKVAAGVAEFAMNSPEGCVGWNTPPPGSSRPKLKAVAAMLQAQTSAIVTLASSGLDRPAKLDGKVYASYAARYEGRIVQKLLQADGGSGDYEEVPHPFLQVWDLLQEGKADATWVFMGWEGVEARLKGVELNAFHLQDFGIPYGYAPVLMAAPALLDAEPAMVRAFLGAAARGFEFAAAHPDEAASLLLAGAQAENGVALDAALVRASQAELAGAYLDADGRWGRMSEARWSDYLDWLSGAGLLTTFVQSRAPKAGVSASLDELRQGNAGEPIPREALAASSLFVDLFPAADAAAPPNNDAVAQQPIGGFVAALAAKQSTPGGGAAAAVGAAVGAGAAAMAAAYSQRKKDVASGAAAKAQALLAELDLAVLLSAADADAAAYAELQRTWKDVAMSADEKAKIEATALAVPVTLVEDCHRYVLAIQAFLPECNPNITSDAKVGIHQLAGAARAAFQTVLVNAPPDELRDRLKGLLREVAAVEAALLEL